MLIQYILNRGFLFIKKSLLQKYAANNTLSAFEILANKMHKKHLVEAKLHDSLY